MSADDVTGQSGSAEQLRAEEEIRKLLSHELGVELAPKRMELSAGTHVDVDGVAPDESLLVEIFAHQGPLKGGQRHKIQGDSLKLITLGKTRPASRLIIALCDQETANGVTGWLAHTLEAFGVEKRTVNLPPDVRARLLAAQLRQKMVNPPLDLDVEG